MAKTDFDNFIQKQKEIDELIYKTYEAEKRICYQEGYHDGMERARQILMEESKQPLPKKIPLLYGIYIKSHSSAPDYEDECYAASKDEAAHIFAFRINKHSEDGWNSKDLLEYIDSLEEYEDAEGALDYEG